MDNGPAALHVSMLQAWRSPDKQCCALRTSGSGADDDDVALSVLVQILRYHTTVSELEVRRLRLSMRLSLCGTFERMNYCTM